MTSTDTTPLAQAAFTTPPKSITVSARRWTDVYYGNPYFSAEVYVDGIHVGRCEPQYGYGTQHEQEAAALLQRLCLIPLGKKGRPYGLSNWCRRNGVAFNSSIYDVRLESDL